MGGDFRGETVLWENFVCKEGDNFPWRNLGVSAGVEVHARGPAGVPYQGSLGIVGVVHTLLALWALLECCLGGRTVRPPRGGAPVPLYAAYSLWHGLRWGLPVYRAPFCPQVTRGHNRRSEECLWAPVSMSTNAFLQLKSNWLCMQVSVVTLGKLTIGSSTP